MAVTTPLQLILLCATAEPGGWNQLYWLSCRAWEVVSDSVVGNQLYRLSLLLYVVPWERTAITITFKWEITLNMQCGYTYVYQASKKFTIASMHVLGMFCCVTY